MGSLVRRSVLGAGVITLEHEDRFLWATCATERQESDVFPTEPAHTSHQALGLIASDLPHTKLSLLHARCGDGRHELNPIAARQWTIGVEPEAERDGLEVVTVAMQWT